MLNSLIDKINVIVYRISTLGLTRVLILGLVIRIGLMPFTAHPFDVWSWYRDINKLLDQGINPYDIIRTLRPLWILTLLCVGALYIWLSSITGAKAVPVSELPREFNPMWGIKCIPGPLFNILVKIPMVMSDALLFVLIYKLISERYCEKTGILAATLFYLNPAVIWISSAWGQYESIPALFTVLSLYLLVKKRLVLSSLSLLTATSYKVYPVLALLPISVYLLKREGMRHFIIYMLPFIALIPVSILLWSRICSFICSIGSGVFFDIFGFGLTYWSISLLIPLDTTMFIPISIGIMVLLSSITTYYVLRADFGKPLRDLTLLVVMIGLTIFLSVRYPTEQRFVWIAPLLAILASNNRFFFHRLGALSLLAFLYMQKNFPYYLLPIAVLDTDALAPLFHSTSQLRDVSGDFVMRPTPLSAAILALLGIAFSIIALSTYIEIIKTIKNYNNTQSTPL